MGEEEPWAADLTFGVGVERKARGEGLALPFDLVVRQERPEEADHLCEHGLPRKHRPVKTTDWSNSTRDNNKIRRICQ